MSLKRLHRLKSSTSSVPPAVIIHGPAGKGKSSLASEFPSPIYMATRGEATPNDIDIPSLGMVETWKDVVECFDELTSEEHDFQTLIIDTLDGIERLAWDETCARHGFKSVHDNTKGSAAAYGKGILAVDELWLDFIKRLDVIRERGMAVVLVAHCEITNFDPPGDAPFKRYDINVDKRARAIVRDWAQYVFFMNTKIAIKETDVGFEKKHRHADGGSTRWIFTDERPAFDAKNRACSGMPSSLIYKRGEGFATLANYMFGQAQETMEEAAE